MVTKKHSWVLLGLLTTVGLLGAASAQEIVVGEDDVRIQTPHPYPGSKSGQLEVVWQEIYNRPKANYVDFDFKNFELAPGDFLVIRNPERTVEHIYRDRGFGDQGAFVSLAVFGDTAILELYSVNKHVTAFGYDAIVIRGYSDEELSQRYDQGLDSVCSSGGPQWQDAVCLYDAGYFSEYFTAQAGVRLLNNGRGLCSGWLVSCQNHILTNNHCFASQAAMNNIQTVFGFQRPACGSGTATPDFELQGGTFISTSVPLDYTLYIPNLGGTDPQSLYGWIAIDVSAGPVVGDLIFLAGHPGGRPRQISLFSTSPTDGDGFCHLNRLGTACRSSSFQGLKYMCDTAGGSSGSFVVSRTTFGAIGLHDCGGCPNTATSSVPLADALSSQLPSCSFQ